MQQYCIGQLYVTHVSVFQFCSPSGNNLANVADVWAANSQVIATCSSINLAYQPIVNSLGVAETCVKEALTCKMLPLGFHLSTNVKEKIWNMEFIDLFALLPSFKETFFNWLQAFCTYASILGEKFPQHCSFHHINII